MQLSHLRPLVDAVQWRPVVAVGAAGLMAVEASRLLNRPADAVMQSGRYSLVFAAGCAALAVDDPAASIVAASPTPLSRRRAFSLAVTLAALVVCILPVGLRAALLRGDLPVRSQADLVLEVFAYAVFGCAVAAVAYRWGHTTSAGIAGAAAVMAAFVTSGALPEYARLFPATPFAPDARSRLVVNIVVVAAVLAWASRDPARRRPIRRKP